MTTFNRKYPNIPTIRDVIADGENGFLCGQDVESIKERIELVLGDEKKASEIGKAARNCALERFSIDRIIEKEIGILKTQ